MSYDSRSPRRLIESEDGLAARLLESARAEKPSPRSWQRALAAAGAAATTTVIAGTGAAAAGTTLAKTILIWLCAGAATGAVTGVAAIEIGAAHLATSAPARAGIAPREVRELVQDARARLLAPESADVPSPQSAVTPRAAPALTASAAPLAKARAAPARSAAVMPAESALPRLTTPDLGSPPAHSPPATASVIAERQQDTLAAEVALLDAARLALSQGRPSATLADLDRYQAEFGPGHFEPEVWMLRFDALCALGKTAGAQELAKRFLARYPRAMAAARVRSWLERSTR